MVNYDEANGTDAAGALKDGIQQLKSLEWDKDDLGFIFNQIEIRMETSGIKKQWSKLQALTTILPKYVIDELKPLLCMRESEFEQNNAYHLVKTEILRIFGPADGAAFERAMSRVLTGQPSQLARALVNDLCKKKLKECCCSQFIHGLWLRQLPSGVRQQISNEEFTHENFNNILKKADKAYQSSRPPQSTVAAIMQASGPAVSTVSDTAFHQDFPSEGGAEVAAMGFGRGGRGNRGGRGGRGGGRGQSGQGGRGSQGGQRGGGNQRGQNRGGGGQGRGGSGHPRHKTQRHADLPPFETCFRHWTFGKSAHFCMEPASCPWKEYFAPRANN